MNIKYIMGYSTLISCKFRYIEGLLPELTINNPAHPEKMLRLYPKDEKREA